MGLEDVPEGRDDEITRGQEAAKIMEREQEMKAKERAEEVYRRIESSLARLQEGEEIEVDVTEEERRTFERNLPERANPSSTIGRQGEFGRRFAPLGWQGTNPEYSLESREGKIVLKRHKIIRTEM